MTSANIAVMVVRMALSFAIVTTTGIRPACPDLSWCANSPDMCDVQNGANVDDCPVPSTGRCSVSNPCPNGVPCMDFPDDPYYICLPPVETTTTTPCPLAVCREPCFRVGGSDGCPESVCFCPPSCENFTCSAGEECQLVKAECVTAPCFDQPQCVPTNECICPPQTTACTPTVAPTVICNVSSECRSNDSIWTEIYDECVVHVETYVRSDDCCPGKVVCGVVVTLRDDTRWLIHDPLCDDDTCEMVITSVSCMSSEWKSLTDKKITASGVRDYVHAGNGAPIGQNVTDCSESCKSMANLP